MTYTATSSDTDVAAMNLSGATTVITPIAVGTATVTAMAADSSGLSATQTFTVTVNPPPNRAPTAVGTIPTQTVTVGGSTGTVDMSSKFSDPDGDALTYTVSLSDTAVAMVSVSGTTVTITPVATGTATVMVIGVDADGLSAVQTFTVMVNPPPNQAPAVLGSIPTQTVTAGGSPATVNLESYFSDPDGDTMTYTVSLSNTGVAMVSVSGATVTVTPVAAGTATVTAMATDSIGLSTAQTFTVTVNPPPNRSPIAVGSIPTQTVTVGGSPATVDVSGKFSDPDGDALTYTVSLSDTAVAMVSVSGTTVTIVPVAAGTATVMVMAVDADGLSAAQTFGVTVNPQPNRSPVAVGSISTQIVTVGGSAGSVDLSSKFSDPDGDTMTYTVSLSDTGVATASVSGTTVTITPVAAGTATVMVVAVDSDGLSAVQTFGVTVNPQPNQAPVALGPIPTQAITVGGDPATVNLGSYFSDADGDALTYTATAANAGVATVSISGATVTITPVAAGATTVTATAADSGWLSAFRTFIVTVNLQPNRAPVAVGSIGSATLSAGGGTVEMNVESHFNDPDGDTLTYAAASSDTGVAVANVSGTTVTITPVAAGTATITVIAADPSGLSTPQTISVEVNPQPNRAPVAVVSIGSVVVIVGKNATTINLANHFSDPDGDTLTYTAVSSDTSKAKVSVTDATLAITPEAEGTATVTASATDTSGLAAAQTIAVTVQPPPNKAPTFSGSANFSVTENSTAVGTLVATDIDTEDKVTGYMITDGLDREQFSLSAKTGALSFNAAPNFEKPGSTAGTNKYIVVVEATSGEGERALTVEQTLTITVTDVNEKPTAVKAFDAVTVNIDGDVITVNMADHFSDPDDDPLHYAAESDNTDKATVSVSGSVAIITPVSTGTATITVSASDSVGLTVTQPLAVTIDDSTDGTTGFGPGGLNTALSVIVNINGQLSALGDVVSIDTNLSRLTGENSSWTVANGDTLVITVNAKESGLDVTADVSALDTTRPYPIQLIPNGNGIYTLEMVIGEDNMALNGSKMILITTKDALGKENKLLITGILENQIYLTQLLPNYPNPFNPETWIPYRLKEDTDVTLTIYDASGQVVRQLALGHQRAGSYTTRAKAIYWDGTNDFGEPVASGTYFYSLSAGSYTGTRKANIMK